MVKTNVVELSVGRGGGGVLSITCKATDDRVFMERRRVSRRSKEIRRSVINACMYVCIRVRVFKNNKIKGGKIKTKKKRKKKKVKRACVTVITACIEESSLNHR